MHETQPAKAPTEKLSKELDPSWLGGLGLAVALAAPHLNPPEASIALALAGLAAITVSIKKIDRGRS